MTHATFIPFQSIFNFAYPGEKPMGEGCIRDIRLNSISIHSMEQGEGEEKKLVR